MKKRSKKLNVKKEVVRDLATATGGGAKSLNYNGCASNGYTCEDDLPTSR